MKRFIFILFLLPLLGCATTTAPVVSGSLNTKALSEFTSTGGKIFLTTPVVTFENASTESPLPSASFGGEYVESFVLRTASSELKKIGIETVTVSKTKPLENMDQIKPVLDKIMENRKILTSSYKDKSSLVPHLHKLKMYTGTEVIGFQTVRVKVGRGSTYDPNSGAMSQGTSSSSIKFVLVSLSDGAILCKNSALVRYLPATEKFKKAVSMLFDQQS